MPRALAGLPLSQVHEKPVYVRLREVIADGVLAGQFSDGDPLPSVRALAAEQGANPLTVAKAYQGFQDEGFVVVKRGVGMFVAPGAAARLRNSQRDDFIEHAKAISDSQFFTLGRELLK